MASDRLLPFASGSDTSEAAAVSMSGHAPTLRTRTLLEITARGSMGLTCAELEDRLTLRHQTASARVWELRQMGLLVDSGQRRRTASGRSAVVWVAA